MHALVVEHYDFAVLHVADVLRADDVEGAGFRGQDRMPIEPADDQRTNAEGIAGAEQLFVGKTDERIGAFELAQPLDEPVDEAIALRLGDQMQDDLGIGGRLHERAFTHQMAAQGEAVGQVAVVSHGKAAAVELCEQRLHVAQNCLAGGGVTHMPHGRTAG